MYVTYFHRAPTDGQHSIERLFRDIRDALPKEIHYRVETCRFVTKGLYSCAYNMMKAIPAHGDVNHITGDVHYLAIALQGRKTILTVHDLVTLRRPRGIKWIVLYLLSYYIPINRAGIVTVVSESTKQQLLGQVRCDSAKIRLVYDCVSPLFKPEPFVFRKVKPTILQIGTSENKNVVRVAEALRGIQCHFRILGRLSQKQIDGLHRNSIEYSSCYNISDREVVNEYTQCDMLIFASTYEGFGMPIIEANATGRPVLTSNILCMPEVAGDAACLVDPSNVDSIRSGVLRVIRDGAYREYLIDKGYENAKRFRADVIASQYSSLYRELLCEDDAKKT